MIINTHSILLNITNKLTIVNNSFKLVISKSAFNLLKQCIPNSNTIISRAIFMFQCAQGQQINCAPKFLDQYMYKFSFFFFLVVVTQQNQKFSENTNFAPPKAVAPQGHGLIGLRHKVALIIREKNLRILGLVQQGKT